MLRVILYIDFENLHHLNVGISYRFQPLYQPIFEPLLTFVYKTQIKHTLVLCNDLLVANKKQLTYPINITIENMFRA